LAPATGNEREVTLFHLATAQLGVQIAQHRSALCDQEASAGLAIEPVDQLELLELWMYGPQRFDHAEADTAATVHGDSGGLVDDDEVPVLEDHGAGDEFAERLRRRLDGVGLPLPLRALDRRQPDAIARSQSVSRLGAPAIHPHLAGPQDPVYEAARHAAQRAQ
jgi:hypothetical protein